MKRSLAALTVLSSLFSTSVPAKEVSPLYANKRLLAGSGEAGFVDGNFIQAAFRHPLGLAFSSDGNALYVADSGNHAIRRIDLAQQNRVDTLMGNGTAGDAAGDTGSACLSSPTDLALSADQGSLYIQDAGNRKIKALDLKSHTQRSLFSWSSSAAALPTENNLILDAKAGRLYWIDSSIHCLFVGDLKSGKALPLLEDPALSPGLQLVASPAGLMAYDKANGAFSAFLLDGKGLKDQALKAGGYSLVKSKDLPPKLEGLHAMGEGPAFNGTIGWDEASGSFHLFDSDEAPVLGLTDPQGASIANRPYMTGPIGLCYDRERAIIYAAQSNANIIQAFRDENTVDPFFKDPAHAALPSGRSYAAKKPAGVTRILIIGTSFLFVDPTVTEDPNQAMAAQFERQLNVSSAMDGSGAQYEVLSCVGRGTSVGNGFSYLVSHPYLLDHYQIDQVAFCIHAADAVGEPLLAFHVESKDDVPASWSDPEFAQKSYAERSAGFGPELKKLIGLCRQDPSHCQGRMNFDANGDVSPAGSSSALTFLDVPEIADGLMRIEKKIVATAAAVCKARGSSPFIFILPNRDYIAGGEQGGKTYGAGLNDRLKRMLNESGIRYADLIDEVRLLEPYGYPLWPKGEAHMLYNGMAWYGRSMSHGYRAAFQR